MGKMSIRGKALGAKHAACPRLLDKTSPNSYISYYSDRFNINKHTAENRNGGIE
jgi:hypothetical protein